MDSSTLLNKMHANLSKTDFKAICRNREFNPEEVQTYAHFEQAFLSGSGLKQVFHRISREEVILLHLLAYLNTSVKVPFFERIYKPENPPAYYHSFNEKYNDVYKKIKQRLLQTGLLIETEKATSWQRQTKLEMKQFYFPEIFALYLPPLFSNVLEYEGDVQTDQSLFRKKLTGITEPSPDPEEKEIKSEISIQSGNLTVSNEPFSAKKWNVLKTAHWNIAIKALRKRKTRIKDYYDGSFKKANEAGFLQYAFSLLKPDPVPKWVLPQETVPLIRLNDGANQLYGRDISGMNICESGWMCGCLSRIHNKEATYYGPADNQPRETSTYDFIRQRSNQRISINVNSVPIEELEYIGKVSHFELQKGILTAQPNNIKIGNLPDQLKSQAVIKWLIDNIQCYAESFKKMEKRKGKYIIHKNLMIAKVTDLVLKVQIQKHFISRPGAIINLSDDFIAFPSELTLEIDRIVKQAGYVAKTIPAGK